jgi:hypothetical protein
MVSGRAGVATAIGVTGQYLDRDLAVLRET